MSGLKEIKTWQQSLAEARAYAAQLERENTMQKHALQQTQERADNAEAALERANFEKKVLEEHNLALLERAQILERERDLAGNRPKTPAIGSETRDVLYSCWGVYFDGGNNPSAAGWVRDPSGCPAMFFPRSKAQNMGCFSKNYEPRELFVVSSVAE